MTAAALLAAAAAVLLLPDRRVERRRRLLPDPVRRSRHRPAPEELPVSMLSTAIAAGLAAAVSTPLVAVLAAVLAAVAARTVRARRRADRVERQLWSLTEGLGALTAELRSGRPLDAATEAAVTACGDRSSGRALGRAVRAPGTDPPAEDRPEDVVLREALRRISAAVLLSSRTGCSLAGVLRAVEDDLRARRRQREELRAATAGPGSSALVLAGLPVLGLAMGAGVGADPWHVLTATGTGQVLLVTGVALELAGLAWSRRLIRRALR